MLTWEAITSTIEMYLESKRFAEAEKLIDQYADMDISELADRWDFGEFETRHRLSILYNNMGLGHRMIGYAAHQRRDGAGVKAKALDAHRCHEKALDIYDVSPEDFMFYPVGSPFDKNLILTFWGLGSAKYVLDRDAEAKKYLLLCVRFQAEDDQASWWQADRSNFLRLIDRKPVQIVMQTQSVMPDIANPQILRVEGTLLEWGAYAKPPFKGFTVYVGDDDITWLSAHGYRNAIALEDHILVLTTDDSGDLGRPLRIVQVI